MSFQSQIATVLHPSAGERRPIHVANTGNHAPSSPRLRTSWAMHLDEVREPLASGHGENGFVSEPASGNDGRHIQYTKSFGDFTFAYDLTLDASNADATKSATGSAVTLVYKMGDLKVVVGSDSIAKYKNDGDDASAKSTTGVAATYELTDGLSLTALSAKAKKVDNSSTQYTGFKVACEMGAFDFTLASQRVKPNGGTSSTEMAYGVA